MSYLRRRGLGDVTPAPGARRRIGIETWVRLALPITGSLMSATGYLLGDRSKVWAPWLVVTGTLITAVSMAAEILEYEQAAGRIQ
jgi:hypothetical protein